jgi:hypothetical protein
MMKRRFKNLLLFAAAVCCWHGASAQHTLGFTAGYGMASARFDPKQEMKGMWGISENELLLFLIFIYLKKF